ncbi:MAG: tetratricopeptide repeat protein [Parcubacteria group bacterium]|nr:tetratricopeptide repeat protein [Parcubacteria group bacterium]
MARSRRLWIMVPLVAGLVLVGVANILGPKWFLQHSQDFLKTGKPELARATAYVSRMLAGKDAEVHFSLGLHLRDLQEYPVALGEFRRASELDVSFPLVYREIGRFYFLGQNLVSLKEAVANFSKEIEVSNDPYSYHLRGILYAQKLGKLEEAEADFRSEIELSNSWGGPLNLAWVLLEQRRLEEAETAMQMVQERRPDSVFVHNGLGVIYLNQGKLVKALSHLEQALVKVDTMDIAEYREAYPGNNPDYAAEGVKSTRAGIVFNLGVANEKQKNIPQAISWYQKALELAQDLKVIGIAPGVSVSSLETRIKTLQQKN